jgi:hypothetical protein
LRLWTSPNPNIYVIKDLHKHPDVIKDLHRAADEIERLRTDLATLIEMCENYSYLSNHVVIKFKNLKAMRDE